ncbi:hypothetical protein EXIGLDRAFT_734032 [Exidia glandulosa HHB12029]|uniref:Uncharacterized protein n=1 Tax=Exidia glandulosa HHB12029 TaxID=1314781 RepID=A0A165B5Z8_EXIGL|nr:hypothetical protein EXIGLDRAFT_734032 [Exidia glandulosa HHB12029]
MRRIRSETRQARHRTERDLRARTYHAPFVHSKSRAPLLPGTGKIVSDSHKPSAFPTYSNTQIPRR